LRNIKHHTIVVSCNDHKKLEKVRAEVVEMYKKYMEAKGFQLISPVIDSLINGYCSFFIAPDGSKEGYDASDDADKIRKLVVKYLMSPEMKSGEVHFVEISYGSDDGKAEIINHN
jgi:hypothetical protein